MDISIRQRLFTGGLWVSGGKTISLFCNLGINALLARLLKPEDLGVYFLIFSLVNFFMLFALLGMERSIVRIVSESLALNQIKRARNAIYYALQIGIISSSILAVMLYSGLGQFISNTIFNSILMSDLMFYPAIWIIIFTLQRLIAESFRGLHDIRFATIFNGTTTGIISVILLGLMLLFLKKASISNILFIIVSSYAINATFAFIILLRKSMNMCVNDNSIISRSVILKTSWILHLTNISFFILITSHLWLLAYYSDKESVAIFGAVLRIVALITSMLSLIQLIILPTIGDLYAKKKYPELENVLRVSATISSIPSIIVISIIIIFGKNLLLIVFGEFYQAGYYALLILSIAQLIGVLTGHTGDLMIMASKEKYLLTFSLFSVVIGTLLSLYLVKPLGVIGVSIGSAVGIIIQSLLMFLFCLKKLSINTCMDIKKLNYIIQTTKSQTAILLNRKTY